MLIGFQNVINRNAMLTSKLNADWLAEQNARGLGAVQDAGANVGVAG